MTKDAPQKSLERTLRCPRCRRRFNTMRRFLVACTECGHSWQEESVVTWGDRLSEGWTNLVEHSIHLAMWSVLLLFIGGNIAIMIYAAFFSYADTATVLVLYGLYLGTGLIFGVGYLARGSGFGVGHLGRLFWYRVAYYAGRSKGHRDEDAKDR
jgi:hypothetical protein